MIALFFAFHIPSDPSEYPGHVKKLLKDVVRDFNPDVVASIGNVIVRCKSCAVVPVIPCLFGFGIMEGG